MLASASLIVPPAGFYHELAFLPPAELSARLDRAVAVREILPQTSTMVHALSERQVLAGHAIELDLLSTFALDDVDVSKRLSRLVSDKWNTMVVTVYVQDPSGEGVAAPGQVAMVSNGRELGVATINDSKAQFVIPYSPDEQAVDRDLLRSFDLHITVNGFAEYSRIDWPWARGEWKFGIKLSEKPVTEQYARSAKAAAASSQSELLSVSSEAIPFEEQVAYSPGSMCNGWSNWADHPVYANQYQDPYWIQIATTSNRGSGSSSITGTTGTPFLWYVKETLPNEWIPSWNDASLKAGGMAVKQYAWMRSMNEGPKFWNSQCWDVKDSIAYQVWVPNSKQSSTDMAVDYWWTWEVYQGGSAFETAYWSGNMYEGCGVGLNGWQMRQWGTKACGDGGMLSVDIVPTYYSSASWHQ